MREMLSSNRELARRFAQLETRLDKKLTENDRAIGAILDAVAAAIDRDRERRAAQAAIDTIRVRDDRRPDAPDVRPETLQPLAEREHERAAELQRQGKWLHLWRVAGKWANVSIFKVDSPAELHEILESLPLYRYMAVEVMALCRHPGALHDVE